MHCLCCYSASLTNAMTATHILVTTDSSGTVDICTVMGYTVIPSFVYCYSFTAGKVNNFVLFQDMDIGFQGKNIHIWCQGYEEWFVFTY